MDATTETNGSQPMMDTKELGPIEKYNSLLASNKFVFLMFYRGHWCPFCMAYLKTLESLTPKISSAGGKILIVTAEKASFLEQTRKSSGYQGEAIVDEENVLAKHLKTEGKLDVAISKWKGYPNGMAQPAFLISTKEGEVFEKWAIVPAVMNMGGAKDRPDLEQVWANVTAKMEGKPRVHNSYKLQSFFGTMKKKFFG